MKNKGVERTVCSYVLKGEKNCFADERIKWHLLDTIGEMSKQLEWEIYAFCLTDEEAYFIIEARQTEKTEVCLCTAADRILNAFWADIYGYSYSPGCFMESSAQQLGALSDIAECCRRIHRLPLLKGYVSNLNDYWWSSYNTYVGSYEWKFMNSRIVLLHFSADYEEAVCRFRYFHRAK